MLRELAYKIKRKRRIGNRRKNNLMISSDIKKTIGIVMIIIGVILIFMKLTGQTKAKEITTLPETTSKNPFITCVQDLNVNNIQMSRLFNLSIKEKKPYATALAIWVIESYKNTSEDRIYKLIKDYTTSNGLSQYGIYEDAINLYSQFIYDIEYFPLAKGVNYAFENGWKEGRVFKGNRKHYGIDIMDLKDDPGTIKIVSMTDGIVENVGWNETGGYRVGIRTDRGAYFYYAHLYEEPQHIKKGDKVQAGDIIGVMGNTGYGPEGTRGEFQTHLHIGIAVKTKDNEEFWINPYYILKFYEKYKVHI